MSHNIISRLPLPKRSRIQEIKQEQVEYPDGMQVGIFDSSVPFSINKTLVMSIALAISCAGVTTYFLFAAQKTKVTDTQPHAKTVLSQTTQSSNTQPSNNAGTSTSGGTRTGSHTNTMSSGSNNAGTSTSGGTRTGSHTPGNGASSPHWLMTSGLLGNLLSMSPNVADHFFNSNSAFVKSTPVNGLAATPIASYTSYAQFAQDLSDGSFPANVQWVMFGIESTTNTPLIEQQQPNVYLPKFAELAHQHGLKVIEVPGMDLVYVNGADCHYQYPETTAQAYLNCHIPQDSSQADIYLIEAQGYQSSVSDYTYAVTGSSEQALAANPTLTIMSGLTTDRGDSATQIFSCWQATHNLVSGYWMNSTSSTLPEADQVLQSIMTHGG